MFLTINPPVASMTGFHTSCWSCSAAANTCCASPLLLRNAPLMKAFFDSARNFLKSGITCMLSINCVNAVASWNCRLSNCSGVKFSSKRFIWSSGRYSRNILNAPPSLRFPAASAAYVLILISSFWVSLYASSVTFFEPPTFFVTTPRKSP